MKTIYIDTELTDMTSSHWFLRTIALLVLMTFSMMILTPAAQAARLEIEKQQKTAALKPLLSNENRLTEQVQQVLTLLQTMDQKLKTGQHTEDEQAALKLLSGTIGDLDTNIRAQLATERQSFLDKQLSNSIVQRHQSMIDAYSQNINQLKHHLDQVLTAKRGTAQRQGVTQALKWLKTQLPESTPSFDPDNMPNRSTRPNPKQRPRLKREQFIQSGLYDRPATQVAALGDFTFNRLAGANNPAYLSETDEVVLTQLIKDKATELQHDPVKIFHWVRNNVEWQPSWGAVQDSDLTVSSQRGNAMDIASLTIALLRASKIPARYVHGTLEVPAAAFKNWAGGFEAIHTAASFAASAGIPLYSTGSSVRMEHIWVEAAIDYFPSRGAHNKDADAWVEMDSSFKQYQYEKGVDVAAISELDMEKLAQDFLNSGTINEAEGSVSGLNPAILQNAQQQAQDKLEAYVNANLDKLDAIDLLGGRRTIVKEYPVLPSSLPNPIVVTGARYDALPVALQQQVTYRFAPVASLAFGLQLPGLFAPQDENPLTLPWAKVNNHKLTLSFKAATAADEQAILAVFPSGNVSDVSQLPSSLSSAIQVIPELKLDGVVIKSGQPMKLGSQLSFGYNPTLLGQGEITREANHIIAGSFLSVAAFSGSVSPQRLQDAKERLEKTKAALESGQQAQIAALTKEELIGDLVHAGTLVYFTELFFFAGIIGQQSKGHYHLRAGQGTFGYMPKVNYLLSANNPASISAGGFHFDLQNLHTIETEPSTPAAYKTFNTQVLSMNSFLEHSVPEQLLNDPDAPSEGVSTMKALAKARAEGQKIYHITQANQASILPRLQHDDGAMRDIERALAVGKEVIAHTNPIDVPGWTGSGYIIQDMISGDGGYIISGGTNGGFYFEIGFIFGTISGAYILNVLLPVSIPFIVSLAAAGFVEIYTKIMDRIIATSVIAIFLTTLTSKVLKPSPKVCVMIGFVAGFAYSLVIALQVILIKNAIVAEKSKSFISIVTILPFILEIFSLHGIAKQCKKIT